MRTKLLGSKCKRKRRRNSSSDTVKIFCSLLGAESRQRKGDLLLRKRDQTMVGDGHAMGVSAQILEHILGATEGRFRVDHPIFSEEGPQPSSEGFELSEGCQISTEAQSAALECLLETGDELPAKDAAQHFDGEKKSRTRWDPVRVIET